MKVVLAATPSGGIGLHGKLPWPHISSDIKFFKQKTSQTNDHNKQNAVIMGKMTYFAIPEQHRPLKHRLNIVLTSSPSSITDSDVITANSLDNALSICKDRDDIESVFVIGGARSFNDAINDERCTDVYLTEIQQEFEYDRHVDLTPLSSWKRVEEGPWETENDIQYRFTHFQRQ